MTSALVSNGAVVDFYPNGVPNPISFVDGNGLPHQVSCAAVGWVGDGATADFSVLPAVMDNPPQSTSYPDPSIPQAYVISNGQVQVTRTWITPTPQIFVPRSVTNAQARAVLMQTPSPANAGKTLFDDIDAYCIAQGGVINMAWNWVNDFTRNGAMVELVLKGQFGQTDDQIDALFIAAAAVTF